MECGGEEVALSADHIASSREANHSKILQSYNLTFLQSMCFSEFQKLIIIYILIYIIIIIILISHIFPIQCKIVRL